MVNYNFMTFEFENTIPDNYKSGEIFSKVSLKKSPALTGKQVISKA